jgi:hypothetical protein
MAKPVITAPTSPRIIAAGVAITGSIVASGSPTSYAATGLPSGIAFNTVTGVWAGTPLVQTQTTATFTATNGDGTSEPVTIIFIVMETPPGMGGPFDIMLDYEITTNEVTMPGVTPPAPGEPLFFAPRGTNRFLLLGVKYYGVLQDLNPASEPISVKIGMKEAEPERLLEITTAATSKVADKPDDQQRYRIPFRVTPANWGGTLSDFEADPGTQLNALAELQVLVGTIAELYDEDLVDSSIAIQGNITSAITGDHDFLDVPEFATSTPMRLTLTLAVAGRALQTVELVRTFNLIFTGGTYVISGLSGSTTGTGAIEGTKWRATLNLTSLAGDADGVDADYSITTSADTTIPNDYIEISGSGDGLILSNPGDGETSELTISSGYELDLWDGNDEYSDTLIGTFVPSLTYDNAAAFAAALLAGWETASGENDVVSVTYDIDTLTFRINLENSTAVTHIKWGDSGATYRAVTPSSLIGTPTTCSVTANLEQLEAPDSIPLNLTSNQFLIGVARDIVPD